MGKKSTAVEFTKEFTFVGTVDKLTTFSSKGGGLKIELETGDQDVATDVIKARSMACEVTIRVSAMRAKVEGGAGQGELDMAGVEGAEGAAESGGGAK